MEGVDYKYDPAGSPVPLFTGVAGLDLVLDSLEFDPGLAGHAATEQGCDLILAGSLGLSNEVVVILEGKQEEQQVDGMYQMVNLTNPGEYYLRFAMDFYWAIVDPFTGEVVMDIDTVKSPFFRDSRESVNILLPIEPGNEKEFAGFFRDNDLSDFVMEAINEFCADYFHLIVPYYKTTTQVEE